jgi:hypothetical protein
LSIQQYWSNPPEINIAHREINPKIIKISNLGSAGSGRRNRCVFNMEGKINMLEPNVIPDKEPI